jgi:hypothetical protein
MPIDRIAKIVDEVRAEARAVGRDPSTLEIVCRGVFRVHSTPQGPGRRPLWGTIAEIREDLGRYAAVGLTELVLEANFDQDEGQLERALDAMAALAPQGGR